MKIGEDEKSRIKVVIYILTVSTVVLRMDFAVTYNVRKQSSHDYDRFRVTRKI